jgi:hypothetical protein
MAHWQLGEQQQARAGYDSAVQGIDKNRPKDAELGRLKAEAAGRLGIQEESSNE